MFRLNKESASKRSFSPERAAPALSCVERGEAFCNPERLKKRRDMPIVNKERILRFSFTPRQTLMCYLGEKNK